ncbi:S-layer homology domain-containing protein [Bacillaceae bacterium S4-13-56]
MSKNTRKFAASTLAATTALAAVAPLAVSAETQLFTDVNADSVHAEAINALAAQGIINGYTEDGVKVYKPTQILSRSQAAALLTRALDLEIPTDVAAVLENFNDVDGSHYFADQIAATYGAGIFLGDGNDNFNDDVDLSREQMATVLVRAFDLVDTGEDVGINLTNVEASHKANVKILAQYGITTELDDFRPQEFVPRDQFATFLYRAMQATTAPAVTSVSANNLKEVTVTFNTNLDVTTAEDTNNYSFASGSGLSVTDAVAVGNVVTLTVNDQDTNAAQQQIAGLTIEGVKSSSGQLVGKTTESVRFIDVNAPEVSNISVVGPKTLEVKFSEPLSSQPSFSVNDGVLAIVGTTFTKGSDTVTISLGAQPTEGTHNLTVSGGTDYATFKVDKVTKAFSYAADVTAPTVSVKSATPNKVVLTFSENVVNGTDANVEFYHTYKGIDAYKATKGIVGKELTLTFANPLPQGPFNIYLDYTNDKDNQIQDLWGNKVAEQTISGTVVVDTVAPTVTEVKANSNTSISVTYSESVSGAGTLANYTLTDAAGNPVNLTGTVTVSGNTYTIPVPSLNGGSYTLSIKNVKDDSVNQNKLADYTTTVSINDIVAPQVDDILLLSDKKVKIVFDEVMNKSSIENKLNYLHGSSALDSKVTVTAVDSNKAVILDFTNAQTAAQADPKGNTIKVLRVLDASGNPIALTETSLTVPTDVSAPQFDKATVTGKNQVKLYFKEVITGAKADDFIVSNGATSAAVTYVSNAVLDGKSVITLTTANDLPTNASNVTVSTTGIVDAVNSYGAPVALSAEPAGDKYAPTLNSVTIADSVGSNSLYDEVTLTFSETLYAYSVQDSDFTVEGYTVTGVKEVNAATVKLSLKENTNNLAKPTVTLVGAVEDSERNVLNTQVSVTVQ